MMLRHHIAAAAVALSAVCTAQAQEPWLHIYTTADGNSVTSMPMEQAGSICLQQSGDEVTALQVGGEYFKTADLRKWVVGRNTPVIRITTTPTCTEITSKTTFLDARIEVDGMGVFDDSDLQGFIRGRGNTSWGLPKKPYRLKFEKKQSLCGFKKAKNYCLLANFLDESFMRNWVALAAGRLVELPYCNHTVPVDVYLNDRYKGTYMLTEKVGINAGSVNLSSEDEPNSILFELDTYYDEPYKFLSNQYYMPVQIKDPDAPAEGADAWFQGWQKDFSAMETAVYYRNNVADYIDYESLARFLVAFNIACNQEICHPKSIFMYKTKGGKYHFGPAWDFDWAFGYEPTYDSYITTGGDVDPAKAQQDAIDFFTSKGWNKYDGNWHEYPAGSGNECIWYEGQVWVWSPQGLSLYDGSSSNKTKAPSYMNPLLATGKNYNHSGGMGGGGEFFLGIIKDNKEFMAVYKRVWEDFYQNRLDEFWAEFDAYARWLEPSAINNGHLNYKRGLYFPDELETLREWVKNRIDFINKPENNYGLYE